MCGRFTLRTPASAVAEHFALFDLPADALEFEPRYNVAPSQPVAAVRTAADGRREMAWLRWGLVPAWADDPAIGNRLINARAETVATKPAFRDSFRQRRCLVPADGFYEWRKGAGRQKQPYWIARADEAPFAFAALWDHWQRAGVALDSCTLITTQANDLVRPLHDRMPVILPPDQYARWLDPELNDPTQLEPLLRPFPAELMQARPVDRYVNAPANEGPACLAPPKPD